MKQYFALGVVFAAFLLLTGCLSQQQPAVPPNEEAAQAADAQLEADAQPEADPQPEVDPQPEADPPEQSPALSETEEIVSAGSEQEPAESAPAQEFPEAESPEEAPAASESPAITWDPTEPVASEEFVLSNGVAMEMTYDEVLAILGDLPDAPATPSGDYVMLEQDGVTYTFHPGEDQVYRLTKLYISEDCRDITFFRDIGIGMHIDEVFARIPAQDTELKQWAWQTIYEDGGYKSSLEFVALSYYFLRIVTPEYSAHFTFAREGTTVKWVEIYS